MAVRVAVSKAVRRSTAVMKKTEGRSLAANQSAAALVKQLREKGGCGWFSIPRYAYMHCCPVCDLCLSVSCLSDVSTSFAAGFVLR